MNVCVQLRILTLPKAIRRADAHGHAARLTRLEAKAKRIANRG